MLVVKGKAAGPVSPGTLLGMTVAASAGFFTMAALILCRQIKLDCGM
jgi:hypothetical protein